MWLVSGFSRCIRLIIPGGDRPTGCAAGGELSFYELVALN
jgi:hypothetical protein